MNVSGGSKVQYTAGIMVNKIGAGAAIGTGGKIGDIDGIDGIEVSPDTLGLYDTGFIKKYEPGSTVDDIKDETAVQIGETTTGSIIVTTKTISFDACGGSCDTATAQTVSSNGSQVLESLPIATRENYIFDGWYTYPEGGDKIMTTYQFTSDMTVYAHWINDPPAPVAYTITFDPNGGAVSPKSGTTETDGKLISFPTPSWEGHTFTGWFTEKDGGTVVTTSTVFSSDDTIYAHWDEEPTPEPEPEPAPKQEETKEDVISVSDNKPMAVSTETKGEFKITYANEIPFFGKGKITPESFGGLIVSQGNATYKVTKIKVNKKKLRIQITGLQGADKETVKKVKKETKGSNGLPFKCNPYYVRDTDKVTPKFKKSGDLKSVKVFIDGKDYKAKKDEYSYDSSKKQILFKGNNLNGSYNTK